MDRADRPDLGILLVHGIGEQQQGGTLLQMGQPLFLWLYRWLGAGVDPTGRPGPANVRLSSVELRPDEATEPAHATLHVEVHRGSGETVRQRWVLAESWWSQVFTAPRFTRLAFWLLTLGPWLGVEYGLRIVRRSWKDANLFGLLFLPLVAILGPAIGALVAVVVVVLLVLYWIPVGRLRRTIRKLGVALARNLGDAYILVADPMKHAAMIERIERDLGWLRDRGCARLAVVAHSQGAALSHALLRGSPDHGVGLFVSVGSAVGRLDDITRLRQRGQLWQVAAWGLIAGVGLIATWAVGLALAVLGGNLHPVSDEWLVGAPVGGLLLVAISYLGWFFRYFNEPRESLLLPGLRWVDVWASADPVPNGPLFEGRRADEVDEEGGTPTGAPLEREVFNRRWPLTDHTSYWANTDQGMSRIAQETARTAGVPLLVGADDEAELTAAPRRRRRRTAFLSAFRIGLIVLSSWMVWALARPAEPGGPSDLGTLGEAISTRVPEWLRTLLEPLAALGKPLGRLQPTGAEVAGAIVVGLALLFGYLAIAATWRYWDLGEIERLFRRGSRRVVRPVIFLAGSLAGLSACLVIGLIYGGRSSLIGLGIGAAVLILLAGVGSAVLRAVRRTRSA